MLHFQLFFLAGFLNCLAGQPVCKRLCGSDPRIAGELGSMECTVAHIRWPIPVKQINTVENILTYQKTN